MNTDTPETYKERDEARAQVEIITPHENNPVAEFFSSSNTPETDAAVIASNGQWSFVLKEACQRLERERNKAVEDATNYFARIGELEKERDEAREDARHNAVRANANAAECCRAWRERNEARELAEAYKEYAQLLGAEINDMVIHAHVHGLKFSRFEQGKVLHEKIKQLEKKK